MPQRLLANKIRCRQCGDVIQSFSVHDFKYCSCGACAVDGGLEYERRIFNGPDPDACYEELSTYEENVDK